MSSSQVLPDSLRAAWRLFADKNWAEAAAHFRAVDASRNTSIGAEAAFGLAHACAQSGDLSEIPQALETAFADTTPATRNALSLAWRPFGTQGHAINPPKAGLTKTSRDQAQQRLALLEALAMVYHAAGDLAGAITVFYTLVSSTPRTAELMTRVGQLWAQAQDPANAMSFFRKALAIDPDFIPALDGLADALVIEGQSEEARGIYSRRAALGSNAERAAAAFKAATVQPALAMDASEIDEGRGRMTAALAAGPTSPFTDPWQLGLGHNFYADYHARDNRALQEATARYFLAATPSLAQTDIRRTPSDKIRLGWVSGYLNAHTVGYLTRGTIEALDRSRFDLVLFRTPGTRFDSVTQELAAIAPVVDLPPDLPTARRLIAEAGLDVLHYAEIGMDRFAYFLAFARLAPLQTVGWGHPMTTGLPGIDLFLSVNDMEPANGATHYSEELVRLRSLSINVEPPRRNSTVKGFAGIESNRPAYVCPQSLYKLHYLFDDTLRLILERDRDGFLYFVSHSAYADGQFLKRLERSVGANIARVKILPRTNPQGFLDLVCAADVLLDVPQWSGGRTSLEALAMGTPIVHQPGEFMRGRHTTAFLHRMNVSATVAENAEQYAATALRLVHDKDFRRDVRGQIAENKHRLFGDIASVREMEDVWAEALKKRLS